MIGPQAVIKPLHIREYPAALAEALPVTCDVLQSATLVMQPRVSRVALHGSRGLAAGES